MKHSQRLSVVLVLSSLLDPSWAFLGVARVNAMRPYSVLQSSSNPDDWSSTMANGGGMGGIERLEFTIFPDGRVEETVRGVKGNNCHQVTEAINKQLGEVVSSAPTEEMYEQVLLQDQTIYTSDYNSGDGSTW